MSPLIGCIQPQGTSDGRVHIFEMEMDGSSAFVPGATAIFSSDAPNYTFDFVPRANGNHHFCAIKTRNTGSGMVEIYVLSRSSNYRSFIFQGATPIPVSEASDYVFVMGKGNGDLLAIKVRNTSSFLLAEVFVLSHLSSYRTFSRHALLPIMVSDVPNFVFGSALFDRACPIKVTNTLTLRVEMHPLNDRGVPDGVFTTGFSTTFPRANIGTWLVDPFPFGVYALTTGPTPSGRVEFQRCIAVAPGWAPPPPTRPHPTLFSAAEGAGLIYKMIGETLTPGGGGGF